MDSKQPEQNLNCYQKLELLNDQLKRLARVMEMMRDGLQSSRRQARE